MSRESTAKAIGRRVERVCRPLVREHGWRDAATRIGLPTSTLRRATLGTHLPSPLVIVRICRYFGVSADDLLGV